MAKITDDVDFDTPRPPGSSDPVGDLRKGSWPGSSVTIRDEGRATSTTPSGIGGTWLDHQYDPGYYTGWRIPPFMRRAGHAAHVRRPSRLGYLFIATGALTLLGILAVSIAGGGLSLPSLLVACGIGPLQVLVGWQLSRGATKPHRQARRRAVR